ncbi:hypothetical protein T11_5144 [Trichinella zimbabwensis]|uniref:Uncharacterized protein n=1 Tax=Trichinella zimbabwensis TaxID=268475 RepID=A0A0V1F480_9BILA|nr:hypothetical protein T11_5144 [Trichinella zimbabwensis]
MYLMKEFCRYNIIPLTATTIVQKQLQVDSPCYSGIP